MVDSYAMSGSLLMIIDLRRRFNSYRLLGRSICLLIEREMDLAHNGLNKAAFLLVGIAQLSFKSRSWVSGDDCLLVKPNSKCAILYASGHLPRRFSWITHPWPGICLPEHHQEA